MQVFDTLLCFSTNTCFLVFLHLSATSHGWAIKEDTMLTPLGYYEAYELVVVVSPKLSDLEKVTHTLPILLSKMSTCARAILSNRGSGN